jgi:hypothetical protein
MNEESVNDREGVAVNTALQSHGHRHQGQPLTDAEVATISAICNRLSRLRGNLDRDGLFRDFEIIQSHCPLDLDALAASEDTVFIGEIMSITESTDRTTRSLRGSFSSRFIRGQLPGR